LASDPSYTNTRWSYWLRDPTQQDFSKWFPKAKNPMLFTRSAVAKDDDDDDDLDDFAINAPGPGRAAMLPCYYYDVGGGLDLELMDKGQILRAIGIVATSQHLVHSCERPSMQLVNIRG